MTAALEKELIRLRERHEASPEGRAFAPLADCYRKLGRLEEALELCKAGLNRHPGYSTAVVILGKIHRDRADWDAAREAFDRVLDLDPMNLLARAELARLFERQDFRAQALAQWRQLLAHDPASREAEEAIERMQTVQREEQPTEPKPAVEAELDETEIRDEDEFTESWRESGEDSGELGDDAPARVLQAQLDDPEEPRRSSAVVSGPATPTLARIYYEQGFKAKALDVYKRVLEQRGDDTALQERIERIRDELAHTERIQSEQPADGDALLDAAESHPARAAAPLESAPGAAEGSSEDTADVEILAASIEASDPEREDYGHFRSWLDRVRER